MQVSTHTVDKPQGLRHQFLRRWCWVPWRCLLLAPGIAWLLMCGVLLHPPTVHADGGAPNLAYVSGTREGITIIDLASQQITGTVALSGDPQGLVLSPDSRFLYVAQAQKNQVAVIDARAKQVTATLPTGPGPTAVLSFPGEPPRLWVANTAGGSVTVLEPDTRKTLATIPVGQHPSGLAWAPQYSGISETDGSGEIYVANTDSESVTVLNTDSLNVITTIALQEHPLGVTIPALGGTAYVTTREGHVYGLTLGSHEAFGPVFSGQDLHTMDYDATTGQIYVPDSAAQMIHVLRPVSSGAKIPPTLPKEPLRQVPIAGAPWAVAITNDSTLGLVAQRAAGTITILDVPGHKAVATVQVGGTPQFVLAGPYPPVVSRQSAQVILILVYVVGGILLVAAIPGFVWFTRRQLRKTRALVAAEDAAIHQLEAELAALDAPPPRPSSPRNRNRSRRKRKMR